MKYTILMGSPRRDGNTAALLQYFMDENRKLGVEQEVIWLYDRKIEPCLGCKVCQDHYDCLGCVREDDLRSIFDSVQSSDVLVLATPIYAWFCTSPMKSVMDRLIYAGCKYYGKEKQRSVYAGKRAATIATCGYKPQKGADLWEEGLRRWCAHAEIDYLGMFCRRDVGRKEDFTEYQVELDTRKFAHTLKDAASHGR